MKKNRKVLRIVSLAAVAALLVCAIFVGGSYAKYRSEVVVTDKLSYTNQLSKSFSLQEYELTQQRDGSSVLTDTITEEAQTYQLIPGAKIPQDPFITVEGKTDVAAVLYLEVATNAAGITYDLTDDWTRLDGVTGPKGGQVYAFQGGRTLNEADTKDGPLVVHILRDQAYHVDKNPGTTTGSIRMAGYLVQSGEAYTVSAKDAAVLFASRVQSD